MLIMLQATGPRALIRKVSAATPGWRPSCLKLLMVTMMRQSSSFLKHHTAKMLIQGCYLATKYFGSYVKGGEDIMF